ncbi:Pyruvate/Phosphoenolpyruvate kinase-like domain-containing protein [Pseudomassariella vexata]|uniref:Pyruvate/Phosphoenolpyruvate kinase-like domain-containing protein n=1 Tax=Pseudomassariella vexata TaxID=1141098 RepID=A0A1Y2EEJ2_9PEZI|nr:Pyruvate/Phosphoenolpyruvate kinase-like domain-containing protein [Pseudomassariella vexata]ORY69991.1 Pyruvate/Phosphoenolpyruvate kinase-like domain-containing protein [Pseudomassariella vexata]
MAQLKGAAQLRKYLADPDKIVVCPGVHDGLTARMALNVGFDALYMTGAGTAASRLGQPDLGLTTVDDMATNAGMIAGLDRNVPVIADADTGFGGPLMVARTTEKYILQGVAAFHIEDQVTTKRCGHLRGKELVDVNTYCARIRAAAAARKEMGSDIMIIARTDSLQSLGYEEAVRRLKAAVEAGADVAFLEGMTTKEDMANVVKDMAPTPCFLNMVSGGVTPLVNADEAKRMGYKIVIWPLAGMTAVYLGMRDFCRELKSTGEIKERYTEDGKIDGGVGDCFELCGLSKCGEFDQMVGGTSFAKGA